MIFFFFLVIENSIYWQWKCIMQKNSWKLQVIIYFWPNYWRLSYKEVCRGGHASSYHGCPIHNVTMTVHPQKEPAESRHELVKFSTAIALVLLSIFSSIDDTRAVIMKNFGATSHEKVGIVATPDFQWSCYLPLILNQVIRWWWLFILLHFFPNFSITTLNSSISSLYKPVNEP